MVSNPIDQRPIETDILPGLLRIEPFVPQNLFPFRQKFLINA